MKRPAAAASWWKNIQRFWLCITHLGSPVVPDVEFTRKRSSAPNARAASAPASKPHACGLAVAVRGHDHPRETEVVGHARLVALVCDDRGGGGLGEEMTDLGVARSVSDPHHGQPGALGGHERDMDRGAVGEQHREAGAAPQPGGGERGSESRGPRVVLRP